MANATQKTIVVPWDFTPGSEIALQHAIRLAQVVGDNIMILHPIRKPRLMLTAGARARYQQQHDELQKRLEHEAGRLQREYDDRMDGETPSSEDPLHAQGRELHRINILSMVLEIRSLRKSLADLFVSVDVNLIVSKQFYTVEGERDLNLVDAFRRIKSSKVETTPFIIVNQPPQHQYYTELVVPMDYDNTYKEKLRWVAYLSNYYHCNVNLMKPYLKVDRKKKGMANNLYFTKKILDSKNVVYGIKTASRHADFREEVFSFTKTIDSDLIILMTSKLRFYFPDGVVTSDVPIMFINPLSKRYQAFY